MFVHCEQSPKIEMDPTNFRNTIGTVKAFDSTSREIIGDVDLKVVIGHVEFEIVFQVVDIKSTFNLV